MSARRVLAILAKDLRDAFRDGRVAVLLVLPIALAVFYNATVADDDELPTTTVAIVDPGRTGVGEALVRTAGRSVEVTAKAAADATAARTLVRDDDAAFAVVAAPAASGGGPARAQLLVPTDASPTTQSVIGLVPDALTRAAGRSPTAVVTAQAVGPGEQKPFEVLGARNVTLLLSVLLLVTFVALMVVPIQTAEELEKGTFGALRLAATGPEILTAKALAGFAYAAIGLVLTVVITGLDVADPVLFYGGAIALVVSLVGFGLLLGLVVANGNAINTFGGVLLVPVIGLAVAVLFVDSGIWATLLDLLPFTQATKLVTDGLSPEAPFAAGALPWIVIAIWAVGGYALLARIAARREL